MADRRRRRHSDNDSGEEFSQDTTNSSLHERPSECESEGEHIEQELSEYESAADESKDIEEEDSEEETETEEEEDGEDEGTAEEDSGDDVVVEGEDVEERQSGDGEEQPSESLDDDEDKKNPAYIPRKGAFFEHDMRLDPDADEQMMSGRGRGKGRLWKDETKWSHDRYTADEQAPKSRQELIALYGYDILAADRPPEAPPKTNIRRGPRNRKFQDFIPSDGDRPRDNRARGQYDNDFPPVQSDYSEEYPPPRGRNEGRGRGRGGRGSRGGGQGQRRNYSDLQENVPQRNRPFSNRDRGTDYKNDEDNIRSNRNNDNWGGRNRSYSDDNESFHNNQENTEQNFSRRGYQDNRNRNRDDFGRDRNRDNLSGNRDNYPDSRGDFSRNRDNFRGDRGRRDNFRERSDNFQGNRDYNRGNKDSYRYDRSDSNQGTGYTQDRNTNYRDDRQNRRYTDNQNHPNSNKDKLDTSRDTGPAFGNRRYSNDRDVREGERDRRSEGKDIRNMSSYDQREGGDRQYLKPEPSEIKSQVYDKMKSYYTLSPVTDDEKLLNEGLEIENSANSPLVREDMHDLNITVSDLGNRKTYTKDKRSGGGSSITKGQGNTMGEEDTDNRKQQFANRHQPVLPPRLQNQERKKQAQTVQPPAPSPAPERTDPAQRGSSKRYSSQRQRNAPDAPGFSESPGVQSPSAPPQTVPPVTQAPVQVPKLSEPAFFNPAFSPPKPGVSMPPPSMIRPPPNFPPAVSAVIPVSTVGFGSPTVPAGPRVPSPQRVVSPQILQAQPRGPPPVFATSTSEPTPVASVSMIAPPPQLPLGVMYAVPPPPPFQMAAGMPIPQFPAPQTIPPPPPPAAVPGVQVPQSQPQESVRGGTTYYSSEGQPRSKSSGTTYYPPELQKKSRVTVRRPKVAIPIVNPEELKKDEKSSNVEGSISPASVVASDLDKLKLESQSPGEAGVESEGSPLSRFVAEAADSLVVNQKLEAKQKTGSQQKERMEIVEENLVHDVKDAMTPKHEDTSHEYLDKTNLENKTGSRSNEEGKSLVEKKQSSSDVNLGKSLPTRTVSVSDKLIPEVKLEFKVQADVSPPKQDIVRDSQAGIVKNEVEAKS